MDLLKKLSLIGTLTFFGLFFYFYRNSGKFRKSIASAIFAVFVLFFGSLESQAKDADGFTPKPQQNCPVKGPNKGQGLFGSHSRGEPNNNGSDGGGGSGDDKGIPQSPQLESVEATENRLDRMQEQTRKLKEVTETDSEAESESDEMCPGPEMADKNGFVMSYDEAYNLVKETYPDFMQITEDCRFSDWQGAKKAYHAQKGFGIDLDKYKNINKEDLRTLKNTNGGLIPYVQKGGRLPPIELVQDYQQKVNEFCHLKNTEVIRDAKHCNDKTGETPCTMFFNRETNQIALFNQTSGDLITASKFRQEYFDACVDSGQVGKSTN